MERLFEKIDDARSLAQIIMDTVREPLLALDDNLKILFASASFRQLFQLSAEDIANQPFFALDNNAWDLPVMHSLLEGAMQENKIVNGREIAREFPRIGQRILHPRARAMHNKDGKRVLILLGFEDVTGRRAVELEKEHFQKQTTDLLHQKEMLLEEMQHRIVNSLQIIASILMLKARAVTSEETRRHLQDAHRRVMSVAAVQRHLHSSVRADLIEVGPYLMKLCSSLTDSIIGDNRPAKLTVEADEGSLISADAVSLGLIVTELVINALKYAFPDQKTSATVHVRYEVDGTNWKLSVCDNGSGKPEIMGPAAKGGLGTSLVNALANQLEAKVSVVNSTEGMSVSVTHATFTSRLPQAA